LLFGINAVQHHRGRIHRTLGYGTVTKIPAVIVTDFRLSAKRDAVGWLDKESAAPVKPEEQIEDTLGAPASSLAGSDRATGIAGGTHYRDGCRLHATGPWRFLRIVRGVQFPSSFSRLLCTRA
jgi:hypothetical protein